MTGEEFRSRYRMEGPLTGPPVVSHRAVDALGRPVMVHFLVGGAGADAPSLLRALGGLPPQKAALVMDRVEVDGVPTLVTSEMEGFVSLTRWMEADTERAPASRPGTYTQLFGGKGKAVPAPPTPPPPPPPPPAETPPAPSGETPGAYTMLFGTGSPPPAAEPPAPGTRAQPAAPRPDPRMTQPVFPTLPTRKTRPLTGEQVVPPVTPHAAPPPFVVPQPPPAPPPPPVVPPPPPQPQPQPQPAAPQAPSPAWASPPTPPPAPPPAWPPLPPPQPPSSPAAHGAPGSYTAVFGGGGAAGTRTPETPPPPPGGPGWKEGGAGTGAPLPSDDYLSRLGVEGHAPNEGGGPAGPPPPPVPGFPPPPGGGGKQAAPGPSRYTMVRQGIEPDAGPAPRKAGKAPPPKAPAAPPAGPPRSRRSVVLTVVGLTVVILAMVGLGVLFVFLK